MLCCSPGHGPLFNIVVCQCSSIAGCNHIVQLLLDVDLILYSARNSSEILLLSVISLWWYSLRASCSTRSLADTGIMWGQFISENNWEWTDKPLVHIDSVPQDFCFVSLMAPYCCSRESGLFGATKNKELTEKEIVRCDWLIIQSVTVAERNFKRSSDWVNWKDMMNIQDLMNVLVPVKSIETHCNLDLTIKWLQISCELAHLNPSPDMSHDITCVRYGHMYHSLKWISNAALILSTWNRLHTQYTVHNGIHQ